VEKTYKLDRKWQVRAVISSASYSDKTATIQACIAPQSRSYFINDLQTPRVANMTLFVSQNAECSRSIRDFKFILHDDRPRLQKTLAQMGTRCAKACTVRGGRHKQR